MVKEAAMAQRFRKLVVAYDFSPAAEKALEDAIAIAKRLGAEILVVHVRAPGEGSLDSCSSLRDMETENSSDLEVIRGRLGALGLRSRGISRAGAVGDTLFNICSEEDADLLLLGAYGYGPQDRQTLGSTAEHLLRAMTCPVLTYGPCVTSSISSAGNLGPLLVPIPFPCTRAQLQKAGLIATLFERPLELLHCEAQHDGKSSANEPPESLEQQCEQLALQYRSEGLRVSWSVLYGEPAATIVSRSRSLGSPFILMPLRWGKHLSSITSDNVAAHVIRQTSLPVMTYKVD